MALFGTAGQGAFWLAAGLLLFSCAYLLGNRGQGKRAGAGSGRPAVFSARVFLFGVLFFLGAAAGLFRMEIEERWFWQEERVLEQAAGEACVLRGTVAEIGESGSGKPRLILERCTLSGCGAAGKIRKLYCYFEGGQELRLGQKIEITGTGEAAGPARNPGGFDYRLYCWGQGICGSFYGEGDVRVLDPRYRPASEFLRQLGLRLGERLLRIAGEEDAGILKAVLLGDKKEMDPDVYELYRQNGVSHLLAISGLHVSVIGLGLWKALRACGFRFAGAGLLAGIFLLGYGGLVGFGPSVTRAVFMMLVSFLAAFLGRTYDMPSAMCLPALWLLLAFPYVLTQASFQLSFLAAGSAFFPGKLLQARFPGKGRWAGVSQAMGMSVSVQMATAPVVLWHSFELPAYGVLLNLMVIPLMAHVLVSGLAGLLGSFAGEAVGTALLGGAHYILRFYEWACGIFAALPCSSLLLGRPSWRQAAAFYLCVLAGGFCLRRAPEGRGGKWYFAVFWAAAFLFLAPGKAGGLSVVFLDVGQGDGIFLEMDGWTALVDCGSSSDRDIGENSLAPFLKSRGVRRLDTVVLSHGDWDHMSGIRYLLETPGCGIQVGCLVMPMAGKGQEPYGELEALAGGRGIPVVYLEKGQEVPGTGAGKGRFSCLFPPAWRAGTDRNGDSLVLLLEYGNFRMLLTGDAGIPEEEALLEEGALAPVTVLKAGHHGSAFSSGADFVRAVRPVHVVLSYGEKNRYGHPAPEVAGRYSEIGAVLWETAKQGAVSIWTDGTRMRADGFLAAPTPFIP